jgi:trans-aconitate 2-methyltransferase
VAEWNAELYRQFEAERTRPAADLLAQVPLAHPRHVVDLGCGPGNSTELLVRRFPQAVVTGVDNSADMLASARQRLPGCRFEQADIAAWSPDVPPDLLFANAALQWVGGHEKLLPRLLGLLAQGGVLAVQMPDNRDEPSHASMRTVAAEAPWSAFIGGAAASRVKILGPATYYDLLAPLCASLDLWRTAYQHPMASAGAIVAWVRSTGLRPFLDPLPTEHRESFLARYEALIEAAYPPRADGKRLLAFPRLFIVARRGA